ncbi:MAG: hypothetical protein K0A93_13310 [Desulfuromonadaceae bacterium]|nr:hypothetical protein [Desulfuromonadaceae bacterium]
MTLRSGLLMIVLLLALLYPLSQSIWVERYRIQSGIPAGYVIPSQYSRVLSLGNRGLLSDLLFLKAVSFFGGRSIVGQKMTAEDWNYLVASLEVITDLDPYFLDPYFLAEGLLAWDAGLPLKANKILDKGIEHRPDDWRLPFFAGFNLFYFVQDYPAAADYIMRAAQLPGSPDYLQTLAGRLAYYGGKSMTALLFLREMIEESDDPLLRKRLAKRLLALEGAVKIEEAVAKYIEAEGQSPKAMAALVDKGYIDALPEDPYGGRWGLLHNGRVFSTSKFADHVIESAPGN